MKADRTPQSAHAVETNRTQNLFLIEGIWMLNRTAAILAENPVKPTTHRTTAAERPSLTDIRSVKSAIKASLVAAMAFAQLMRTYWS